MMGMLTEIDEKIFTFDGLDEAVIGWCYNWHSKTYVAVYSRSKIIKCLMKTMTEEEADEYCSFNIDGGYVGKYTPIVLVEVEQ